MTYKNAEYFDEQARSLQHPNQNIDRVAFGKKQHMIEMEFWQWAFDDRGLDVLPDSVLVEVRIYAHDKGHADGYSGIYNALLEIEDMVLAAYRAGKKQRKTEDSNTIKEVAEFFLKNKDSILDIIDKNTEKP